MIDIMANIHLGDIDSIIGGVLKNNNIGIVKNKVL
jgi:hypothetical protein